MIWGSITLVFRQKVNKFKEYITRYFFPISQYMTLDFSFETLHHLRQSSLAKV